MLVVASLDMDRTICFLLISQIVALNGFQPHVFETNFKYITEQLAKRAASREGSNVETKWIEQPLDHFDSNENRKFKMKYFIDQTFWRSNGPIFLFVGGEGPASAHLDGLLLYQIANETNGLVVGSEHRYYGESKPPLDLTVTENLKYLSSQQALADLAYLIKAIKSSSSNSKVVVCGGSYPGNLAAWMKLLYPDLVDTAVASSAPVLAKKDFFEYVEKVGNDFKLYGGTDCYQKIQNKFGRWNQLFQTAEGIEQLKQEENICEDNDMAVTENKKLFFLAKTGPFKYAGQYGGPNTIVQMCSRIMNNVPSSLETNKSVHIASKDCVDYSFSHLIDLIKNTASNSNELYWLYQTCTEFGYFQTTNSNNQPFTKNIDLDFYFKICSELFGPEFDEHRVDAGVAYTNKMYGGLHPNVKNVVFVNGDVDPWSTLSILKNLSEDAPARVIKGTTHCADINAITKKDSQDLIDAKKFVILSIKKFLGL